MTWARGRETVDQLLVDGKLWERVTGSVALPPEVLLPIPGIIP
jgi:hypothetical protein